MALPDGVQDYTTADELDTTGVLDVDAEVIVFTNNDRSNDRPTVEWPSADVPEGFEHHISFQITSGIPAGYLFPWGIDTVSGYIKSPLAYDNLEARLLGADLFITLLSRTGGSLNADSFTDTSPNLMKWAKLANLAGNLVCYLFLDENEETMLDIMTVADKRIYPVPYLKPFNMGPFSGAGWVTGTIGKLTIGPLSFVSAAYYRQMIENNRRGRN